MSKLTVYLKKNVILSYTIEAGKVIHIGRDSTNDLVIDSPDLAPAHAVVVEHGDNCVIKQLNNDFPLIINGKKIKAANLHDGDAITIGGDHGIVYNTASEHPTEHQKPKNSYIPHVANYQVISGNNIGKIFHLKIPMTLLGDPGTGIVVISKRKDGYYASVLEKADAITINTEPLDDKTVKLKHNDVLVIGNLTVQLYLQ